MGRKSRTKRAEQALQQRRNQTETERQARLEQRQAPQGVLGFERQELEVVQSYHSGPLPSPETLARYDEVVPGMAKGLFENFQIQGRHRRRIESWRIGSDIAQSWVGMFFAAGIAISTIWWSVNLIRDGFGLLGLAGIIGALASLVGVFIYARRRQAKDLEKRP